MSRHRPDLFDLERSGRNKAGANIGFNHDMQRHRANRRCARHHDHHLQIWMVQPVVRDNQRWTAKGLFRMLRVGAEIHRPHITSSEPALRVHPNRLLRQHPTACSPSGRRQPPTGPDHQAHPGPTTTTRHGQADVPRRQRRQPWTCLAVQRSRRSRRATRSGPATLSSLKAI